MEEEAYDESLGAMYQDAYEVAEEAYDPACEDEVEGDTYDGAYAEADDDICGERRRRRKRRERNRHPDRDRSEDTSNDPELDAETQAMKDEAARQEDFDEALSEYLKELNAESDAKRKEEDRKWTKEDLILVIETRDPENEKKIDDIISYEEQVDKLDEKATELFEALREEDARQDDPDGFEVRELLADIMRLSLLDSLSEAEEARLAELRAQLDRSLERTRRDIEERLAEEDDPMIDDDPFNLFDDDPYSDPIDGPDDPFSSFYDDPTMDESTDEPDDPFDLFDE